MDSLLPQKTMICEILIEGWGRWGIKKKKKRKVLLASLKADRDF